MSTTYLLGVPVENYPEVPPEAARGRALRITEVGEDVLHHPCRDVENFGSPELAGLIDDMFATMLVAEGVGLAANQVGEDLRVFVYDLTDSDEVRHVGHVANPVLTVLDGDTEEGEEGCLSVPGPGADLFRPVHVRVRGVDQHGEPVELEGWDYLARCFQHEVGHLHGQLYIDLLSKRVRKRVLRDMEDMRDEVLERRERISRAFAKEPAAYPAS
ncbi:peptide deformylase [Occultella kanbiaonis]|uniref:peptide deformylase n=1 Tax=Occultella kanbiaonis TaxID=2675754 RepID=UPI0012B84522|nr:peptide deformylase [Occultella kanbiaonis]